MLALLFLAAGTMKLARTPEALGAQIPILGTYSNGLLKSIGSAEILGAIGLILPPAVSILRGLTPLAALGLSVIMLLAAIEHIRRKEYDDVAKNGIIFLATAFVAWGRWEWL